MVSSSTCFSRNLSHKVKIFFKIQLFLTNCSKAISFFLAYLSKKCCLRQFSNQKLKETTCLWRRFWHFHTGWGQ
jgi:hypothetical protein